MVAAASVAATAATAPKTLMLRRASPTIGVRVASRFDHSGRTPTAGGSVPLPDVETRRAALGSYNRPRRDR